MDNKNPPPLSNFRDDDDEDSKHSVDISKHSDDDDDDMSVAVPPPPQPFVSSPGSASGPQPSAANNTKRYRPAPAKTFQCRGYGECRMVFSRSEHLARHIRKHTGERPFTCHCGKQFSRLDNLRQHAQTVHADKQEQNDRMMHDLTSLHATMTAASKGGAPRGKRAQAAAAAAAAAAANGGSSNNNSPALDGGLPSIKSSGGGAQDALSMSMRPGTSTGYEGGNGVFHHPSNSWASSLERTNSHSFRDPGQSFRVPPASATAAAALHQQHSQHPGQSFLAPPSTPFSFSLPDIQHSSAGSRPGTSSRPSTATTANDRSLPPISSVVPSSLPPSLALPQPPPLFVPQQREQQQHGSTPTSLTSSHVLPLPNPTYAFGRRPATANRPGTAPASYYYNVSTGSGSSAATGGLSSMVTSRPELSLSLATTLGRRPPPAFGGGTEHGSLYRPFGDVPAAASGIGGDEPTSPVGYDSPFSFHAPSNNSSTTPSSATFASESSSAASSALTNPRKRPYAPGSDVDDDDNDFFARERSRGDVRPFSSGGGGGWSRPGTGYEYGSDSRPQSRRLSVMELCNDTDTQPAARPLVPLPSAAAAFGVGSGGASRPTTSSGLIASASQLALYDRTPSPDSSPAPSAAATSPSAISAFREYAGRPASVFVGASSTAGGANASYSGAAGSRAATVFGRESRAQEFGRGAVHYAYERGGSVSSSTPERQFSPYEREQHQASQSPRPPLLPSPSPVPAAAGAGGVRWGPTSPGRGISGSVGVGHRWAAVSSPGRDDTVSPRGRSPASVGSSIGGGESNRDDQVRVVVGMRV